jgi:hypothetical protein
MADRSSAEKKTTQTRKYGAAGKPAAKTRKLRADGKKATLTRKGREAGRKPAATRTPKKTQIASTSPTPEAEAQAEGLLKIDRLTVGSRLKKAIVELQGLQELLLSGDLDPQVLVDFRDAVNQVRNSAWAAELYVARKGSEQGSTSALSFLAGERIRTAYQLCRSISEDLKRTDIEFQAGSLVQLCEVMNALTERLEGVIGKLG